MTFFPPDEHLRLTPIPRWSPDELLLRTCMHDMRLPTLAELACLDLSADEQARLKRSIADAVDLMEAAGIKPADGDPGWADPVRTASFDEGYLAASRDFAKVFAAMAVAHSLTPTASASRACVQPAANGYTGQLLQHFITECREQVHPGVFADLMDEFRAIDGA